MVLIIHPALRADSAIDFRSWLGSVTRAPAAVPPRPSGGPGLASEADIGQVDTWAVKSKV